MSFITGLICPLLTPCDKLYSAVWIYSSLRSQGLRGYSHILSRLYPPHNYSSCSMQLLDFDLFGNLIHTLEPLMRQASVLPPPFFRFIVTDNTLGIGCALPTAGRAWDFHPLECALTAHTKKTAHASDFYNPIHEHSNLICNKIKHFYSPNSHGIYIVNV